MLKKKKMQEGGNLETLIHKSWSPFKVATLKISLAIDGQLFGEEIEGAMLDILPLVRKLSVALTKVAIKSKRKHNKVDKRTKSPERGVDTAPSGSSSSSSSLSSLSSISSPSGSKKIREEREKSPERAPREKSPEPSRGRSSNVACERALNRSTYPSTSAGKTRPSSQIESSYSLKSLADQLKTQA